MSSRRYSGGASSQSAAIFLILSNVNPWTFLAAHPYIIHKISKTIYTVSPLSNDDDEEAYIEFNKLDDDDDFIDECRAANDASVVKEILVKRAVRYKLSPEANFAMSPKTLKIRTMISLWIYLIYLLLRKSLFVG